MGQDSIDRQLPLNNVKANESLTVVSSKYKAAANNCSGRIGTNSEIEQQNSREHHKALEHQKKV